MQMEKEVFYHSQDVHLWLAPFQAKKTLSETLARAVLQRYLPHASLAFEKGPQGKPYLQNHALSFNFSHSGDYFLMGVTQHQAIGVDIERDRENKKDFLKIAERFFAAKEYAQLISLPESEQKAAFYRCWVLKEAYVKAVGMGISLGFANFEVDFLASQKTAVQKAHDHNEWTLDAIRLDFPDYYAALCVQGNYQTVKIFTL
jgi:4'-phosphopantetheinyl transferase